MRGGKILEHGRCSIGAWLSNRKRLIKLFYVCNIYLFCVRYVLAAKMCVHNAICLSKHI